MYGPFRIGNLTVKNRLVRSATFEFGANDGRIGPKITELYRSLAAGGCGLIVSGQFAVSAGGRIAPVMVDAGGEDFVSDLRALTGVVHDNGSLFFVQLSHGGYRVPGLPGYDQLAVSATTAADGRVLHEATAGEIGGIVAAFGRAARQCKEGGADGVQIHAAHGYLISTFLSPFFNRRTDDYGGPIGNRSRILMEAYDEVRRGVGPDYPVSVKINFGDGVSPSITAGECLQVCQRLDERGIDMIEISSGVSPDGSGTSFSPFAREKAEGHFLDGAAMVAKAVKAPVVSVCGYRTPAFIERTLATTPVAAVSLCRPLIREPDLPNRWKTDRGEAACLSCNKCFKPTAGIVACGAL
jgi:2,4-dienoyl-CoA reductase-like NADH-dependent reductase (Old Yellow Enzyme family)